ncbi:hypothetical protein BS47DRAFT_1335906 [Hydnum rufescens UP504]|uniref:C2H2-type domain-containing protein n=1 Tax=Hydnum rufescens UP504 TaxID=1448309 RepID=A0A9P6BA89_9AGAM|nr:hypothetical protein BS47DRAFT_1335906 [Hydnum rufescens UP504]
MQSQHWQQPHIRGDIASTNNSNNPSEQDPRLRGQALVAQYYNQQQQPPPTMLRQHMHQSNARGSGEDEEEEEDPLRRRGEDEGEEHRRRSMAYPAHLTPSYPFNPSMPPPPHRASHTPPNQPPSTTVPFAPRAEELSRVAESANSAAAIGKRKRQGTASYPPNRNKTSPSPAIKNDPEGDAHGNSIDGDGEDEDGSDRAGTPGSQGGEGSSSSGGVRLPPILQVEKQHVTTSATQAASASRRRNDALFKCPVPGCGSTFTRRFNLRGHLRSHTEERPFVCDWVGCGKSFARKHDCNRHQSLHSDQAVQHTCGGCGKSFSRTDALNRHLRSEGGAACKRASAAASRNNVIAQALAKASENSASSAVPSRSPQPVSGTV